ncbi:hypothetical protein [Winogradskyella sp. A2]|uniref:hypothetical protein n=1 Tax=Winogradskyella sp. A2 TaxID=3366944 RepID=UPI00398C4608
MAPIKFEEQLKEKLEKRTLAPSAEGWAKLSKKLDADDNKSRRPIYWWLSIAAVLVLMIAITTQVFDREEGSSISPQIVNENPIEVLEDKENQNLETIETTELAIDEMEINEEESKVEPRGATVKSEIKKIITNQKNKREQLADNSISSTEEIGKLEEGLNNNDNININQPVIDKTVVAEVLDNIKSDKTHVIDKEVDSLLKLASKELTKKELLKATSKTVDANSLLEEVQDDMGQSFRSRVFDALKDSYETVKTAVVQRNN